jgi:hypothetical protein
MSSRLDLSQSFPSLPVSSSFAMHSLYISFCLSVGLSVCWFVCLFFSFFLSLSIFLSFSLLCLLSLCLFISFSFLNSLQLGKISSYRQQLNNQSALDKGCSILLFLIELKKSFGVQLPYFLKPLWPTLSRILSS